MVIDVDPDLGAANEFRRGAETTLRRGVERDGDIEILRFGRRRVEEFAARQETVFLEQAVFVPDRHVLAELLESERASAS